MSWDILPKAKLQYLLTRLKEVFDKKVDKETGKGLSTNDYTTTEKNKLAGIASGAEVNVQSDWNQTSTTADDFIKNKPTIPAAVAVKGNAESSYRTGNVNLTPVNIGALYSNSGVTINNLNDLVNLLNNSAGQRSFCVTAKIASNIGVGVTGWQRILAVSQNGPNNGTYDLGMFCLFFPVDNSQIKYAVINGKTTGNYSITATGALPYTTDLPVIPTVGNATLNIKKNGASIAGFTANSTVNVDADIACNKTTFSTREFSFSVTLNGGDSAVFDINTSPLSGFLPLGVVGLYTSNVMIVPIYWKTYSNTKTRVDLKNIGTTKLTGTGTVNVLYYSNT